jgi:hypothetical protein
MIHVIRSRRMRWVGHAARMGEMRNTYSILIGKCHSEDVVVDGRIILDCILGK